MFGLLADVTNVPLVQMSPFIVKLEALTALIASSISSAAKRVYGYGLLCISALIDIGRNELAIYNAIAPEIKQETRRLNIDFFLEIPSILILKFV